MWDGITRDSTAYLLLIIGIDTNIKNVIVSSSKMPCLKVDQVSSVLLEARGKDHWEAVQALREDLDRRADALPLWAWFKHKLG